MLSWLVLCMQVRRSAELERQQVVSEVRRQAEVEKDLAILETKKKKWVSNVLHRIGMICLVLGQSLTFVPVLSV